ncbi:hypothetical protein V2G26_010088 [Clonostachys chloroleuca]
MMVVSPNADRPTTLFRNLRALFSTARMNSFPTLAQERGRLIPDGSVSANGTIPGLVRAPCLLDALTNRSSRGGRLDAQDGGATPGHINSASLSFARPGICRGVESHPLTR